MLFVDGDVMSQALYGTYADISSLEPIDEEDDACAVSDDVLLFVLC